MESGNNPSNFVMRTIKASDMDDVAKVLGKAFMTEPTISSGDTPQEDMEKFVRLLSDDILSDDLTLIAETKDGVAAAATMALDFATIPSNTDFDDFSSNHRHISKVLGMLERVEVYYSNLQGFEHGTLPRGHTVHMFMIGTEPAFRQMGLGSALRGVALKHYKSKNYRFAMSEATSLFSRKMCFNFGFESKFRIPYETVYTEGEMKDLIASGHDAVHLMVKELK